MRYVYLLFSGILWICANGDIVHGSWYADAWPAGRKARFVDGGCFFAMLCGCTRRRSEDMDMDMGARIFTTPVLL